MTRLPTMTTPPTTMAQAATACSTNSCTPRSVAEPATRRRWRPPPRSRPAASTTRSICMGRRRSNGSSRSRPPTTKTATRPRRPLPRTSPCRVRRGKKATARVRVRASRGTPCPAPPPASGAAAARPPRPASASPPATTSLRGSRAGRRRRMLRRGSSGSRRRRRPGSRLCWTACSGRGPGRMGSTQWMQTCQAVRRQARRMLT